MTLVWRRGNVSELKYSRFVLDDSGTDELGFFIKLASERKVTVVSRSPMSDWDLRLKCERGLMN